MSDRFAAAAARLAGFAGARLGWTPDEFWRATPEDLRAVVMMLAGEGEPAPLEREALDRMMRDNPDG